MNEKELQGKLKKAATDENWGLVENLVDGGLRHKVGVTPVDFLNQWLKVGRLFGFATRDDSFGEFEKIFSIIIRNLMMYEKMVGSCESCTKKLENY